MSGQRFKNEIEKLESLHQIALALTKITDLKKVLEQIAHNAIKVLGANCITLYQYHYDKEEFETPPLMVGLFHEKEAMQTPLRPKDVPMRILKKKKPHFAYRAEKDKIMKGRFVYREKVKSSAGLPLMVKDKIVGILFINYRKRHNFPEKEKRILRTFATYAAIAIENSRLYGQTSEKLARKVAELEKLQSIDKAMISDFDFDAVLNLIMDKAIELIGPASGRIRLLDEKRKKLIPKVIRGVLENEDLDLAIRKVGECIVGRVAKTGKPENVRDVAEDKDFKKFMKSMERKAKHDKRYKKYLEARKDNIGSEIAIPLKIKDTKIGVLNVYRKGINAFSEDDMKLLSVLADRAASVIHHAKRYKDLQNEVEMLRVMPEIAKEMTADLSLSEVLSDIADGIRKISPGSIPNIFLYDERTKNYQFVACARTGKEADLGQFPPRRRGVGWRVIRKVKRGEPDDFEIIEDVLTDPRASRTARERDVKTTACFPLKFRGHVLGLLYLHFKEKHEFSEEEKRLLAKFADQAAIAIKNAMHFEDLWNYREELSRAINKAWAQIIPIYSPKIDFKNNLDAKRILGRIELARGQRASDDEIEELFNELFCGHEKITVFDLPPGFSGAAVVKVHPVDRGGFPKNEVIVKFGGSDLIEKEIKNFKFYVDGKLGGYRSTLIERYAHTSKVGAVVYLFIGTPHGGIHDLEEYYKTRWKDELEKMVDNLFCETCSRWYETRIGPRQRDLSALYEEELSLDKVTLNESFKKYFPQFARRKSIEFPLLKEKFINPVRWLNSLSVKQRRKLFAFPIYFCITHGDLRNGNIFVDRQGNTWLIDFQSTKENHFFRDFAKFEATVKFELLPITNLTALYEFEEALLKHDKFNDFLKDKSPKFRRRYVNELEKAYCMIKRIRKIASEIGKTDNMKQYFVSLFFYTLHLSRSRVLTKPGKRRHALMSAGLISRKLNRDC